MLPLRRPLVSAALAFVAGTAWGLGHPPPAAALAAAAACTLLAATSDRLAARFGRRAAGETAANAALLAAVALVGWLNAGWRVGTPGVPPPDLEPGERRAVDVIGVVTDGPVRATDRHGQVQWVFPIALERWRAAETDAWAAVSGSVIARQRAWPGERAPTAYGERRAWRGQISAVPSALPGGNDVPRLFFSVSGTRGSPLATDAGNAVVAACMRWRAAAERDLTRGIEDFPETAGILHSLLLGYRSQMSRDLYQEFARTGTLHIFAISGTHVMEVGAVLAVALSMLGLPRTRWVFWLSPALGLFVVVTGLQPSAIRAWVMATAFWGAPLAGRRPDPYAATALAAIVMLAIVPADLAGAGFVLSFVCVLGLVYLTPVFLAPVRRWTAPEALAADQPGMMRTSWWRAPLRGLSLLLAASLAAWLVSAPLTARYFGLFSPIALLGNLVVIPLAGVIIFCGCVSLLLGAVLPAAGVVFNHASLALAAAMVAAMHGLQTVPGGWWTVPRPSRVVMILFYALLLWFGWVGRRPPAAAEREPPS